MPNNPLKVLFVTSEMAPYAKSGGLGDVMGALPDALARAGVESHVLMPLYRCARQQAKELESTGYRISVRLGAKSVESELLRLVHPSGLYVWFLDIPDYYDRNGLYGEGNDLYPDAAARFIALSKAAIELACIIQPDVIHCNDWFTALTPVFLKEHAWPEGRLKNTSSVLTIHNLAYQGIFWYYDWYMLDLPDVYFHHERLEYYGHINFLKGGIVWADAVTTVSPGYAKEILTVEHGCGLEGVLDHHSYKLLGILNGIDQEVWNPARDPLLKNHYSADDLSGKAKNRQELLGRTALKAGPDTAVIGVIGRLVEQKGWPIVRQAMEELLKLDAVFVILGSGDPEFEMWLEGQQEWYPEKLHVKIGFDEELAHLIEAGSDFFLMPSRFEPCGLNQMYSMRYGTVPIAHGIGGLKDSITDIRSQPEKGTGFLFSNYDALAFTSAVAEAIAFRKTRPDEFGAMIKRCMAQDFSWQRSARRYMKLYQTLAERRAEHRENA